MRRKNDPACDVTILLIGSNPELRRLLDAPERRVSAVSSPNLGLARFLLDGPDLLVCDAAGAAGEALEPFRRVVRAAWARATPVLVITGCRDLLFQRHHFLSTPTGPFSILYRPFKEAALSAEVEHLLTHHH